jgi:hypothetical protein
MPVYRTNFKIHIVPALLPQGWPNPYLHEVILETKTFEEFNEMLNKYIVNMLRTCIVIMKDTGKPLGDDVPTMNRRLIISPNIISHVEQDTEALVTALQPQQERPN